MIPILKSWLSPNLEDAISNLNNYEYKSKGLALSNIYFQHLALIKYFYKDKNSSRNTFEKYFEVFELEKLRSLYFYNVLFGKNDKKNKYISLFLEKFPNHSFSLYLQRSNNTFKNLITPKLGISEALYNLAQTLFSQNMHETSLALAQTSLYLDEENHLAKYLISLNLNSLDKKKLSLNYLQSIPSTSYISWNADLTIAELYIDLKQFKPASEYLHKLENSSQNKTEIFYKLGELYHIQKSYNNAIKYFSKAISSIKTMENKYN